MNGVRNVGLAFTLAWGVLCFALFSMSACSGHSEANDIHLTEWVSKCRSAPNFTVANECKRAASRALYHGDVALARSMILESCRPHFPAGCEQSLYTLNSLIHPRSDPHFPEPVARELVNTIVPKLEAFCSPTSDGVAATGRPDKVGACKTLGAIYTRGGAYGQVPEIQQAHDDLVGQIRRLLPPDEAKAQRAYQVLCNVAGDDCLQAQSLGATVDMEGAKTRAAAHRAESRKYAAIANAQYDAAHDQAVAELNATIAASRRAEDEPAEESPIVKGIREGVQQIQSQSTPIIPPRPIARTANSSRPELILQKPTIVQPPAAQTNPFLPCGTTVVLAGEKRPPGCGGSNSGNGSSASNPQAQSGPTSGSSPSGGHPSSNGSGNGNVVANGACTNMDAAVTVSSSHPKGPGHCPGEITGHVTNHSSQPVDCFFAFYSNGVKVSDGGGGIVQAGRTTGGESGGLWACGADTMKYACFPHSDASYGCKTNW